MRLSPRWLFLAGSVLLLAAVTLLLSPPTALSSSSAQALPDGHPKLDESADLRPVTASVDKDTCLHCHIEGEDKNLWVPVSRWGLFSAAGLIFAFGIMRSVNVYTTRKPMKSIWAKSVDWIDERYDVKKPLEKALKKPVPTHALKWFYCLGGITALLFIVQAVTGIMLAFYYKPTPEAAYESILYIENEVMFGAGIRAIHHWAANGMIVMCVAHMLRVFITGAYRTPRELNWVGGTLLFILTLAFGFTGYLLPWDQRAYWATTVGTEIAGGIPDVGPLAMIFLRAGWAVTAQTLSRFFAAHVIVIPVMTVALMGLHFLMVRRQGIAEPL